VVDIEITPAIQNVIDRARAIKKTYELPASNQYLFPSPKGTSYAKTRLISMWDRTRERAGIKDDVTFKDLRSLAATNAAKAGQQMKDIQKRLVHTSSKMSEIYIKEAMPEVSAIDIKLPWNHLISPDEFAVSAAKVTRSRTTDINAADAKSEFIRVSAVCSPAWGAGGEGSNPLAQTNRIK
jgi:hypothetical protein